MAVVTGTVTKKGTLRRVSGKDGRSWLSMDAILRTDDNERVRVYLGQKFENTFDEGDIVRAEGKKIRSGFSASSIKVVGRNRNYVPEVDETTTEEIPAGAEDAELELGYVSQPKLWYGKTQVSTKVGEQWVNIPVSAITAYFDDWDGSFPNSGFGTLRGLTTQEKHGTTVHKIISWTPKTRATHKVVPLRDVSFRDGYVFADGTVIRGEHLPFPSSSVINEVKNQFDGDLVIELLGLETLTGHWDKGRRCAVTEWRPSKVAAYEVRVTDDVLSRFQRVVSDADQRRKFLQGIEMVKKIVAQEGKLVNMDELLALAQQVSKQITANDIKLAIWDNEYDERYFKILSEYSTEIFPWSDGFVFVYNDEYFTAAVIERPVPSAATYVFHLPTFEGGIQELITIFCSFNLLDLRKGLKEEDKLDVASKVGLVGVSMHTDIDAWEERVTGHIRKAKTRDEPLIEGPLQYVAAMLGISLSKDSE